MSGAFGSRWLQPLVPGIQEVRAQEQRSKGVNPGFINSLFQAMLALCVLASPHHVLQSLYPTRRYIVTDVYVLAWLLVAVATTSCSVGGWSPLCFPRSTVLSFIAGYRLIEILSRELWIILYRNVALTSFSRVLSVSLLNYATATALFGYLYGTGDDSGFRDAVTISLTFSPLAGPASSLQLIQGAYCLAFLIVVVAAFVARAFSEAKNERKNDGKR